MNFKDDMRIFEINIIKLKVSFSNINELIEVWNKKLYIKKIKYNNLIKI